MSRAAAGFFPYHGMWAGFSGGNSTGNSGSSSQKYSGLSGTGAPSSGSSSNFGYPPTPPKDSSTPDQQLSEENQYGANSHQMNNNNNLNSALTETKPTTEHLMNSISSLSAYAGLPTSAGGSKRLPEGTSSSPANYSTTSSSAENSSMFYYPTTSDLAMYGSSSYGNRSLQSSRPKSKNRSNAGKIFQNSVKCGEKANKVCIW